MATYTTNYNLKKPASEDFYNIADFNGNSDIIDAELNKAVKTTSQTLSDTQKSTARQNIGAASTSDIPEIVNNLTSTDTNKTLSANMGKSLKDSLDNKAAATHTHTTSDITNFPSTMTPSAHNQAASTITAGTLGGKVNANSTAAATLANAQVRDIYAGTTAMTANSTALTTGTIYVMYE